MIPGLIGAPSPSEPRPFRPPVTAESRLANGMRVITASRRNVPLIGAQVVFGGGAAGDPTGQLGRSALGATVLSYGPEGVTSDVFAAALDALGARCSAGVTHDALSVGTSSLTHLFPAALALCNQAIRRPGFAEEDLRRVRARTLSDLRIAYGSANALVRIVAARALYGDAAYGRPVSGVPETIESLTRESIVEMARLRIRPESATAILCGDIDSEAAFALAEESFGDWQGESGVPIEPGSDAPEPARLPKGRVLVVNLPDSGRSAVMIGRVAIARGNPRYAEGLVTMGLLSGYSGRLNREIRVKRGLSYGATAQIQARRCPGPFFASTLVDHGKVGETIEVIFDVIATLATAEPAEAELAPRKAMLRGSFGRVLESVGGLATALAELALNNLPISEYDGYLDRIEAVTPAQVTAFARDYLLDEPAIVVVGDAEAVVPQLRSKFPQLETYSATNLHVLEL
jgi:zinc protease